MENIYAINKKFYNFSQNKNKSSLETNRTTLSGLIKSIDENNNGKKSYNKKINSILYSKYNILPYDHDMIILENFIRSKYCHDLAFFKEQLLFNYNEEFLKRFYMIEESEYRIPKFVTYYKNYLMFFCRPVFSELNLNDLIQEYSEKKAKIFYNNNYKDDILKIEKKKFPLFTLFTPKIKKLISNNNSLINLTINVPSMNNTNNSSMESSILKIINDLTLKKNIIKKNINNNNLFNKKENNNIILKEKISKNLKASSPDCLKINTLGKNLFFIYNHNFNNLITSHTHTKTGTNFNQLIEKVFSDRGNCKKSLSKKYFSKTKTGNNKAKSRNLIINNPLFLDLGIYTFRNEKNNKEKLSINSIHNTINSTISTRQKKGTSCVTERNHINLIQTIKSVEKNENKKYKKNLSRNINRNGFNNINFCNTKSPFSSTTLTIKNCANNFNNFLLKTDFQSDKSLKIRNNSNQKEKMNNRIISNKGINQIKQCIQNQKKLKK